MVSSSRFCRWVGKGGRTHQLIDTTGSGSGVMSHPPLPTPLNSVGSQAHPCASWVHVYLLAPQDFAAPREIVWLNGAPGSGKVGGS